jgi:hypothetical protein
MVRILHWGSIWIHPYGTSHPRFPPIVPPPQFVPVRVRPPAVRDDFMARLPDIECICKTCSAWSTVMVGSKQGMRLRHHLLPCSMQHQELMGANLHIWRWRHDLGTC